MRFNCCTILLFLLISCDSQLFYEKSNLKEMLLSNKCNFKEIDDTFYSNNFIKKLNQLKNNPPNVLLLNISDGNFHKSFELAKIISSENITVFVDSNSSCKYDCSLLYLASLSRYSMTPIKFPTYSPRELNFIKNLSPYSDYITFSSDTILIFLSRNMNKSEISFLREASLNPDLNIANKLNNKKFGTYEPICE